jgi:simple sugar transport system ATP-binding protein
VKALAREAKILILDEPTAVLAPGETKELLQNMRVFVKGGGSVILITHKLRDVLEFADHVTVIRHGKTVLDEQAGKLDESRLAEAMIGSRRDVSTFTEEIGNSIPHLNGNNPTNSRRSHSIHLPLIDADSTDRDVLRLRGVIVWDELGVKRLKEATITVREGEILGVAAVEGNGQYELLRVLARRMAATQGSVEGPDDIGFVPEDRQRDALILDFPLYENVELFGAGRHRGRIWWREVRKRTVALMHSYDIRATGPDIRARVLSGGNQQKLVVGREITGAPAALVMENPTRGLDVLATAAVHRRLREARDGGTAVVLYSSDIDEVVELADRVIVMYDGVVHDVPKDRESVGRAMLGRV